MPEIRPSDMDKFSNPSLEDYPWLSVHADDIKEIDNAEGKQTVDDLIKILDDDAFYVLDIEYGLPDFQDFYENIIENAYSRVSEFTKNIQVYVYDDVKIALVIFNGVKEGNRNKVRVFVSSDDMVNNDYQYVQMRKNRPGKVIKLTLMDLLNLTHKDFVDRYGENFEAIKIENGEIVIQLN